MRTVARSAQLLFGHRSHVGELRSRMTRRRERGSGQKGAHKKRREIERRCTLESIGCNVGLRAAAANSSLEGSRMASWNAKEKQLTWPWCLLPAQSVARGCGQNVKPTVEVAKKVVRLWKASNQKVEAAAEGLMV